MRTIGITLAALVAGFLAGLLISEVIGIAGMLLFRQAIGIKYLPVYLAALFAGAALVIELARRGKSQ